PDRLRAHAAVAAAGLVVAHQRAAFPDRPVGLGGQVARHQANIRRACSPRRRGGVGGEGARRSRASTRAPSTPTPTLPLEGDGETKSKMGEDKAINPPS